MDRRAAKGNINCRAERAALRHRVLESSLNRAVERHRAVTTNGGLVGQEHPNASQRGSQIHVEGGRIDYHADFFRAVEGVFNEIDTSAGRAEQVSAVKPWRTAGRLWNRASPLEPLNRVMKLRRTIKESILDECSRLAGSGP